MEKLAPLCIARGQKSSTAAVEKSLAVSQKVKHRTTIQPNNATPRYGTYTQEKWKHVHTETCTLMLRSIIHNSQEGETNQMSTNWWMNT